MYIIYFVYWEDMYKYPIIIISKITYNLHVKLAFHAYVFIAFLKS